MTPGEWERLKPLFEQALGLKAEERARFVEKVRATDEKLGRSLADLVGEEEMGMLDGPLLDFHEVLPIGPGEFSTQSGSETVTMIASGDSQTVAGRFRVLRRVGRGGMGEVFEAEDLQLKDRVALKVIRTEIASDPAVAARFKREILLGRRIVHPNVCRIHDLGSSKSEDGAETLFLTMEFLNGETLADRIKRGPLTLEEARPLIENMADGLAAAHEAGVIHRDLKSSNVMLAKSPDRVRAVITDFGLARALCEDLTVLTEDGAVGGTVMYEAPEQIRGERVSPAADIYSLGVVIYEMVTGRVPFTGDSNARIAWQHLHKAPPRPRTFAPALDANWETTILGCLRKAPEERFRSAAEVKAALLSGSAGSRPRLPLRRRTAALVSLVMAILILIGFGVWAYREWVNSQQRVAVLEFENIGGDQGNRAFCEGLMEALSSQLTELEQFQRSLSVVPASDVRKDKVTSAREARRDFGATLVITGSVQRSPGGTRLTINVVDARKLKQLRSHGMFVPETDAVSMQQGVITQVTNLLDVQLRPDARQRLAVKDTRVGAAYDHYLKGSGYLLTGGAGVDQAIAEFGDALKQDPNYALAHAGLAEAYWNKYSATKEKGWVLQAQQECVLAISRGPKLAEPHITLAVLSSGTGHYEKAISESELAIKIDPTNDRAYAEKAAALDKTGKQDEAERTLKKAIALRPGYWNNYVRLGIFYQGHGKYRDAIDPFKRVIKLVPDNPAGYTDLASIYHLLGRDAEAEKELKESIRVRPTALAYSNLATVYFFQRRYADAVPIMEELVAGGTKNYLIWGNLGDAYRWTPGDAEKAAKAYQRAIELAMGAIDVNPRNAAALSSTALYCAKSGQRDQALQNIKKALAAAQDDKNVLFKAAVVYELAGERAEALKLIQSAIVGGYSPNEIAAEPELGKLRQDPIYQATVSRNHGR